MGKEIIITKASGETVPFSENRLKASLQRSGATDEQIESIIEEIKEQLYEGISTKKIYHLAFNLLKGHSGHIAAKYHLKQAIMELGPSGYPFEKYVAAIFEAHGFSTKVGEIVDGQCVKHEVDVIAFKDNIKLLVECKYHNQSGINCDVKIPLYIQSRFKDVESQWLKLSNTLKYQGCVVTNTRFTSDAIQYGTCVGLRLIGWDYPAKGSIKEQIDTHALYPITCLTSLTKTEKEQLLEKRIVLCKELQANEQLLESIGIKGNRAATVLQEIHLLCKQAETNTKQIS